MRVYNGDIGFICPEAQVLAKKQSSFKVIFIMHLGHRHRLATIAFILVIYLWWLNTQAYCDRSITAMWSLNGFIPLP